MDTHNILLTGTLHEHHNRRNSCTQHQPTMSSTRQQKSTRTTPFSTRSLPHSLSSPSAKAMTSGDYARQQDRKPPLTCSELEDLSKQENPQHAVAWYTTASPTPKPTRLHSERNETTRTNETSGLSGKNTSNFSDTSAVGRCRRQNCPHHVTNTPDFLEELVAFYQGQFRLRSS